jgi:ribosome-binding protein aMBF1 (putative translation factor)
MIKTVFVSGLVTLAGSIVYQPYTKTEVRASLRTQTNELKTIGKQIRIAREAKRISRTALAQAVGIDSNALRNIETGQALPVKELVYKIEEVLNTTFMMDSSSSYANYPNR